MFLSLSQIVPGSLTGAGIFRMEKNAFFLIVENYAEPHYTKNF